MKGATKRRRSNKKAFSVPSSIRIIMLGCFLLLVLGVVFHGKHSRQSEDKSWSHGSPYGRLFDPLRIDTLRGQVLEVGRSIPMNGMSHGVHLMVRTEKEVLAVHLGPEWYVEGLDFRPVPKDKVLVIGSRIILDGKPTIVASTVSTQKQSMRLRDMAGMPFWEMPVHAKQRGAIHFAWLIWTLFLFFIWAVVFFTMKSPESRMKMVRVSLWTSLFGLTEPLFVPEYWLPPSLFDLAFKTGFDLESLVFAFSLGGLAAVLYERVTSVVFQSPIRDVERHSFRHRLHGPLLLSPVLLFLALLFGSDLNRIYSSEIALTVGGLMTWICRPDLARNMFTGALIFLGFYFLFFLSLLLAFPGYVERVWNLPAISGVLVLGVPLEELVFALALGFYWSSAYEHLLWRKQTKVSNTHAPALNGSELHTGFT